MMAFQILNVAWLVKTSPIAKAVLLSLADRADWPKGFCDPSHRDTANRTSLSEKSVSRGIDELERAGHITVDRSNGRHSKYLVHPKPPTDSLGSINLTTDSQSGVETPTEDSQSVVAITQTVPTTDSQSWDPGLTVHKPRTDSPTNRQEPSLNRAEGKQPRARPKPTATTPSLPTGGVSDRVRAYASSHQYERVDERWEGFKLYCESKGKLYNSPDAAFENALRGNWTCVQLQPQQRGGIDFAALDRERKEREDREARVAAMNTPEAAARRKADIAAMLARTPRMPSRPL